jgi:hypothetical protein
VGSKGAHSGKSLTQLPLKYIAFTSNNTACRWISGGVGGGGSSLSF